MEMDLNAGPLSPYLPSVPTTTQELQMNDSITIRRATAADSEAIDRVAALDSGRPPDGDALVAIVDDEVRAVLPLDGGGPLADPFHPTADLVELLRVSATGRRRTVRLGRPPVLRRRRLVTLEA